MKRQRTWRAVTIPYVNGPPAQLQSINASVQGSTHETAEIRRAKKQIEDMSFQVREMQATLSSLQNTVRAADGAVQEHKGEADRLRRRAQEYLALIKHKDTEVLKLQEQLKERDTKVCFLLFLPDVCFVTNSRKF